MQEESEKDPHKKRGAAMQQIIAFILRVVNTKDSGEICLNFCF